MRRIHLTLLAGAMLGAVMATGGTAIAAPPPKVFSVVEGRDSATDRPVLVLIGKSLTKFKGYVLTDPLGKRAAEAPQILVRGSSMVVLGLASDLPAGAYQLVGNFGKADALTFSVKIGNGAPLPGAVSTASLDADLRSDLDDASTLGGQTASSFRDASNVSAGTLDAARFSAYDDLADEAKIGTDAKQIAAGDHDHDKVYPLKTDLSAAGTLNAAANPVDWTKLKGVPAGLADGVDNDTTYSAGTGLSLTGTTFSVAPMGWSQLTGLPAGFADGVDNDTTYSAGTGLALTGTTFSVASAGWSQLTGMPSGFADGIDNDTLYSAGTGLTLTGTSFSTTFGGTGIASTVARSDHNHNATYLAITGGSMTGALNVSTNTANGASVFGTSSNASGFGVRGASTSLSGFSAGLYGTSSSTGGAGLWAEATATTGANYGVYATTASINGSAVRADATSTAAGNAIGVFASSESTSGWGVYALCQGATSTGVVAEATNTSGASTGVVGKSLSTSGTGVLGQAPSATGTTYGVRGTTASSDGYGVFGENTSTTGDAVGVAGRTSSATGSGVFGESTTTQFNVSYGVRGTAASYYGYGVYGESTSTTLGYGVVGSVSSTFGYGVLGRNTSATGSGFGVSGSSASPTGYGVSGTNGAATGSAYGVYGSSSSSAGYGVYGIGFRGVEGASNSTSGVGVWATGAQGGVALIANNTSTTSTNSIAIFQVANANKARIDQNGKGFFNGGTQTGGADFAESVAVAGPKAAYEPGDVIVIDTNADRSFALSKDAESALVAGVYSTKPGVLAMPHDCAGDDLSAMEKEIPLAVVGIVPVKVCDEGGPIARGDLLVTASLPGHAKKAPKDIKPGTLLGKSLGRLDKGTGRIEVYLAAR